MDGSGKGAARIFGGSRVEYGRVQPGAGRRSASREGLVGERRFFSHAANAAGAGAAAYKERRLQGMRRTGRGNQRRILASGICRARGRDWENGFSGWATV